MSALAYGLLTRKQQRTKSQERFKVDLSKRIQTVAPSMSDAQLNIITQNVETDEKEPTAVEALLAALVGAIPA